MNSQTELITGDGKVYDVEWTVEESSGKVKGNRLQVDKKGLGIKYS